MKKLFQFLLPLMLCLICGIRPVSAAESITTWAQLKAAMESATEPTTIVLTQDIVATAEDRAIFPAETSIVLDLNGYTLDRNLSEPSDFGCVFFMQGYSGIDLTIKDSSPAKTGVITGGYATGCAGCIELVSGSLTLLGGTITGNKTLYYGGGIDKLPYAKLMVGGTARVIGNYAYETGIKQWNSDIHFNDNVLDGFSFATGDDALVTEGEHKAQFGIRFWTGVDIAPVLWTLPSYEAGSCFVSNNQREQYMSEAKLVNGNWTLCLLLHDHEFDGEICTSKCELCGLIREDGIHNMTGDGCTRECSWCPIKFHSDDTYDSNGVCTQCKAHRVDDGTLLDYQGVRYRLKINSDLSSVAEVYGYADDIKESIIIPKTIATSNGVFRVASFAGRCFSGCTSVKHADIQAEVTGINFAFYACTGLESVKLPEGLTAISSGEFEGSSNLTNVVIPNSVTRIGNEAFKDCINLRSIDFPKSVNEFGNNVLQNCKKLEHITLPEGVTEISEDAFRDCINLTSVVLPNSVTKIGYKAFLNCSSLTDITIPNSVTEIEDKAFQECSSLTEITIPNSVTAIGSNVFVGCSKLTNIDLPNSVNEFGSRNFMYCYSLTSITLPNGITEIPYYEFKDLNKLTSVVLPNSVTVIEAGAFKNCSSLTSITLPEGVTTIKTNAFEDCIKLTSIDLPNSVTEIGYGAFRGCSSLTSVKLSEKLTTIGNKEFESCSRLTGVVLPEGLTTIGDAAFRYCSALKSIDIPGSVLTIGEYAFNSTGLTSVTINQGVETVGDEAFSSCLSLTDVSIPSSLKSIYAGLFKDCTSLTDIVISDGVEYIYEKAFYGCSSLTDVVIPKGVEYIKGGAFQGCTNLKSVTIPSSLKLIGEKAFYGCSSLTDVVIPNGVESIYNGAFGNCTNLRSVTIPSSVNSLQLDKLTPIFVGCSSDNLVINVACTEYLNNVTTQKWGSFKEIIRVHDYTAEEKKDDALKIAATCIDKAVYYRSCSTCGLVHKSNDDVFEGEALGHAWGEYVLDGDQTCTNDGHKTAECTREGCSEKNKIVATGAALGHDWGEYILEGDQTCEEDGHKTAMCTREGCTVTNTIEATGAALGHDYTSETATAPYLKSKATCIADAVYFHKCSRCESRGATTWTKEGSALGHEWEDYFTTDIAATCTEAGSESRHCARCSATTDVAPIVAHGHSFTDYISNGDATTEADGTKTAVCDHGCGETDTVIDEGSRIVETPTGITNVESGHSHKAVKVIENGRVVIIRDGVKYDLAGRKL